MEKSNRPLGSFDLAARVRDESFGGSDLLDLKTSSVITTIGDSSSDSVNKPPIGSSLSYEISPKSGRVNLSERTIPLSVLKVAVEAAEKYHAVLKTSLDEVGVQPAFAYDVVITEAMGGYYFKMMRQPHFDVPNDLKKDQIFLTRQNLSQVTERIKAKGSILDLKSEAGVAAAFESGPGGSS